MGRTIEKRYAIAEEVTVKDLRDLRGWLEQRAARHNLKWLLAHADDGVIWGKMDSNGQLITSDSVAPEVSPPLRAATLQQARLFSEDAELLLWHDGDNQWHARLIRNAKDGETHTYTDAIDEPQILWGTDPDGLPNNFTLMIDGTQGLRHAVPREVRGTFDEQTRPLRLYVRHYLKEDQNGFTRIVASRLMDLDLE